MRFCKIPTIDGETGFRQQPWLNERPLTVDMITKSFFANFLNQEAVKDNMATDAYRRDHEINNNVRLMNTFLINHCAIGSQSPQLTTKPEFDLPRIYSSKCRQSAWSEILKDAVCAKLEITDEEDRARPFFYKQLSDAEWLKIGTMVGRLLTWTQWSSPQNSEIDSRTRNRKDRAEGLVQR